MIKMEFPLLEACLPVFSFVDIGVNICKRGKSCHLEIDCSHFSISGEISIFIYLLLLEDNNFKICAENLYLGLLI